MSDADLQKFVEAQEPVRAAVTRELAAGRKASHWMWFVFPQLRGLGHSPTAQHFGLADLDQARRYLADETLGERLRDDVALMLAHEGRSAREILGSPDDLKFRSCLTLFHAAATAEADRALFARGLAVFYDGAPDARTLALIGR